MEAGHQKSTIRTVDTLREAVPYLRRPFMPEAIRFKIQTVFKDAKGCLVVAYIDARLVIERLNMVVADRWTARYESIPDKSSLMWCHLTLHDVTRSDIGEGQGTTDGMRYKAAVSDALKRAAVHFGVGVSVYALPQITLWANQEHVEPVRGAGGKPSLKLTEHGHVKLREGYATWLETKNRFGDPLDHGDVEGAVFDEAEMTDDRSVTAPIGNGSDDGRGISLGPEVEAIIEWAKETGHGQLANRAAVEMQLGRAGVDLADWLRDATAELDRFEAENVLDPEPLPDVDPEPDHRDTVLRNRLQKLQELRAEEQDPEKRGLLDEEIAIVEGEIDD